MAIEETQASEGQETKEHPVEVAYYSTTLPPMSKALRFYLRWKDTIGEDIPKFEDWDG